MSFENWLKAIRDDIKPQLDIQFTWYDEIYDERVVCTRTHLNMPHEWDHAQVNVSLEELTKKFEEIPPANLGVKQREMLITLIGERS